MKIVIVGAGEVGFHIASRLALENKDDEVSLVLMQNAVYFAAKKGTGIDEALDQGKVVYASKKDVVLRGIQKLLPETVKLANYGEIVDIVFNQDPAELGLD